MLTASASAPNTQQQSVKSTPTPSNWFGVAEGMRTAEAAVANSHYEQAEQVLTELLTFAPSEVSGWKLLARVQRELGKIEVGIKSAERALQFQYARATSKSEAPASATLAKLLWQQGEKALAHEMLDLLIVRQPENQTFTILKDEWGKEPNL